MRASIKGQPSVLKKLNRTLILDLLRAEGPMSRADLARKTTLSPPTISRLVSELAASGLVEEAGVELGSSPGRNGVLFRFRSDLAYCIGVHVGERKIRGVVADLDIDVLHTVEMPSHTAVGEETTVDQVIRAVDALTAGAGLPLDKVKALVVGVPGIVDPATRRVVDAPHIRGWRDFPLAERLERRFPSLVIGVRNDVNLALLGERWAGAAKDVDSALLVSYQTGIGCGILLQGHLYEGARGTAGEIGFMTVSDDGVLPAAAPVQGGYGWGNLERVAGGLALVAKARQAIAAGAQTVLRQTDPARASDLSPEDIFLAAARGDGLARSLVDEACRYVGTAVANAVALLDPDAVIIGGDALIAGEYVTDRIAAVVRHLLPFPVKVVHAHLGNQASAYGALVEARDIALNLIVSRHEVVAT